MTFSIFIVTILLAAWITRKPSYKLLGILLITLILMMYLTSIPIFAVNINNMIDYTYLHQMPPKNEKAAIIVLAGGWSTDENGIPFQPSIPTIERLYAAIKLSKEMPSCKFLIMSGGYDIYEQSNISIAAIMRDAAKTMDCCAQIILEDQSRNTDENLKYSTEIIQKLSVKHVVIVTSNSHMERAMNFARKYIPEDIKVYAYPSGGYRPKIELTYEAFLPSVCALSVSCNGIKELIGNVVAKLSLYRDACCRQHPDI